MIAKNARRTRFLRDQPRLTFAPLAWLKLQFFCHVGHTEIGGFAITSKADPLYVEDFVTIRQQTSPVWVAMDDQAVADFIDRCVDAGMAPQQFLRVWMHTHPGSSAEPSQVDEETFERVFGACDWAVMFILSRTGNTFARLSFQVGPGTEAKLPVAVDWFGWPTTLTRTDFSMASLLAAWQQEFATNIRGIPEHLPKLLPSPSDSFDDSRLWDPFLTEWDWRDFDLQPLEDLDHHDRSPNTVVQP
jgi:proteasome lid subunit RPN8/RPN11